MEHLPAADDKPLEARGLACPASQNPRFQLGANSQGCCQRSLINDGKPLSKCRAPTAGLRPTRTSQAALGCKAGRVACGAPHCGHEISYSCPHLGGWAGLDADMQECCMQGWAFPLG